MPVHAAPRRLLVLVPVLAALLLAGCSTGSLDRFGTRSAAVNGLAAQLDHGQDDSYTADYRLSDGSRAVFAQQGDPHRIGYDFDSGRYIRTVLWVIRCTATTCTRGHRPADDYQQPPDEAAVRAASAYRFVTAQRIIGLVRAAAERPGSSVHVDRRTIAGQPARCVRTGGFTGCLTDAGVPALFRGTVDGYRIEETLIRYRPRVVGHPFGPMPGVRLDKPAN